MGWCADTLRLFWGLLYWNLRKAWFRARRGRAPCPCQSPGDPGLAMVTTCDACLTWNRPARFRAICPLLVPTPDGLRCSADAADVRPFWGRAAAICGVTLLGLCLTGAFAAFGAVRAAGLHVTFLDVAVPARWHRLTEARASAFVRRADQATADGRNGEAMLHLASAYELDPRNQAAGILLARHLQAGHPERSDQIYRELMQNLPDRRHLTAQEWLRALLARGDMARTANLARQELLAGSPQPARWVRALIFARRHLTLPAESDPADLPPGPATDPWRRVFTVERLLREGRTSEARDLVMRNWPETPGSFGAFYRSMILAELGDSYAALDELERNSGAIDAGAFLSVRLEALAADGKERLLERELTRMLAPPIDPRSPLLLSLICAHLVRHPDEPALRRLLGKVLLERLPVSDDTAEAWFSLFCAAGAAGDFASLHQIAGLIRSGIGRPYPALAAAEAFFRGESADKGIATFLPALLLPPEVAYALLGRYASIPAAILRPVP